MPDPVSIKSCFAPLRFLLVILLLVSALASCGAPGTSSGALSQAEEWFIWLDYDEEDPPEPVDWGRWDMAILDPDHHPVIEIPGGMKKTVLIAYISIGEAESYRSYWEKIKGAPWIAGPNPNWKDNYYVDVRHADWKDLVLDRVIPEILQKGFDGLFLDTLDTAGYLEGVYPQSYPGARQAMTALVSDIRKAYPEALLISNNGFELLPELAPFLDGMLAEDIHGQADFERGGYRKVSPQDRQSKVAVLKPLMKRYGLAVFNIDYADGADRRLFRRFQRQSRALGFKPYIAEKDLDRIYPQ